jgi:hypothetical protein
MEYLLKTKFGYHDIRLLRDDGKGNTKPTRRNILASIKWLVADARPGDSLFFHFSGVRALTPHRAFNKAQRLTADSGGRGGTVTLSVRMHDALNLALQRTCQRVRSSMCMHDVLSLSWHAWTCCER